MALFVKRPIPVEAKRWTGNNFELLSEWSSAVSLDDTGNLHVASLEGDMNCKVGDMVVKGIRGEFYVCDFDIFFETYEPYHE